MMEINVNINIPEPLPPHREHWVHPVSPSHRLALLARCSHTTEPGVAKRCDAFSSLNVHGKFTECSLNVH
jgi:hypothetical protein